MGTSDGRQWGELHGRRHWEYYLEEGVPVGMKPWQGTVNIDLKLFYDDGSEDGLLVKEEPTTPSSNIKGKGTGVLAADCEQSGDYWGTSRLWITDPPGYFTLTPAAAEEAETPHRYIKCFSLDDPV